MEGVEDIPGTALAEGIDWAWESFPEYLDALETMPRALDVGAQVPHGAVRAYVMGERGATQRAADRRRHRAAWRRSCARASPPARSASPPRARCSHRASDGELVPGTYAAEDELLGIGRVLGELGHGVFEMASDLTPEEHGVAWMERSSAQTGPADDLRAPAERPRSRRSGAAC